MRYRKNKRSKRTKRYSKKRRSKGKSIAKLIKRIMRGQVEVKQVDCYREIDPGTATWAALLWRPIDEPLAQGATVDYVTTNGNSAWATQGFIGNYTTGQTALSILQGSKIKRISIKLRIIMSAQPYITIAGVNNLSPAGPIAANLPVSQWNSMGQCWVRIAILRAHKYLTDNDLETYLNTFTTGNFFEYFDKTKVMMCYDKYYKLHTNFVPMTKYIKLSGKRGAQNIQLPTSGAGTLQANYPTNRKLYLLVWTLPPTSVPDNNGHTNLTAAVMTIHTRTKYVDL